MPDDPKPATEGPWRSLDGWKKLPPEEILEPKKVVEDAEVADAEGKS